MSRASEPLVGTEPPEAPGQSIVRTVEALQRRVLEDLDEVLAGEPTAGASPHSETPD